METMREFALKTSLKGITLEADAQRSEKFSRKRAILNYLGERRVRYIRGQVVPIKIRNWVNVAALG